MGKFRHSLNCILIFCLLMSANSVFAEEIKTQKNEPSRFGKDSWTVVVLPDTQNYLNNDKNHNILNNMMDWVVSEKDSRNIKMVMHVGDMTNRNSKKEWKRIRSSYKKLDNVLPYLLCVGNHDEELPKIKAKINDFFKISDNRFNQSVFKGSYEQGKLQNVYYVLNQNNQKYLFLALEYSTRKAVIDWADKVIKMHQDHRVFITVHNYMSEEVRLRSGDNLPDPTKKSLLGYDDVGIYKYLAKPSSNVEFILCGHAAAFKKVNVFGGHDGVLVYDKDIATGHRSDAKEDGLSVHQILFNAQWIPNGGDGWMLLLEFLPSNKTVKVKTFSPYLNLWRTGPEYEYSLERIDNRGLKNNSRQRKNAVGK